VWKSGAYPGGSGPPPKKFEPQREHGSKFFGGGPDPSGYAHGGSFMNFLNCQMKFVFLWMLMNWVNLHNFMKNLLADLNYNLV